MAQRVTYAQPEVFTLGLNDGMLPPGVMDLSYQPIGAIISPKLTIQDLISSSSSSLDEVYHRKSVSSLAKGLASLDAAPLIGITQTLSGRQSFVKDEWLAGATQAAALGVPIAITDNTGSPVAMLSGLGEAYLLAQPSSGSPEWMQLALGETPRFMTLGGDDQNEIKTQADLMGAIAAAAKKPALEYKGFFTTEQPFISLPIGEMVEGGAITLRPGKKFVGVTLPLTGTPFSLLATLEGRGS
jgi:hypothetical protein